jgi:hypothetical protein
MSRSSARILTSFLVLACAALWPALAPAAPTVTFKTRFLRIECFPGTGCRFGAGADVEAQLTIHGTESTGGVPSQLRQVVAYLPKGTELNPGPFPTCSPTTLEANGPEGCPKGSAATPVGVAGVVDPIGGSLISENATLQGFFAPGGGLDFYANASSPISAQIVSPGRMLPAAPPYERKLVTEIPLVDSVPGAPPVSDTSVDIKIGAAIRKAGKTIYYGVVPRKCPAGGFPERIELTFQSGETVTVTSALPCPRR